MIVPACLVSSVQDNILTQNGSPLLGPSICHVSCVTITWGSATYGASSPLKAVTKYTPPVSFTEPARWSISLDSSMRFI